MRAWNPVITDPVLVRRAEQIIARTADFFSARLSRRTREANPRLDHFLDALSGVDGVPAVALLFAYLHLELGEPGTIEATSAWLDRAIDVTARLEQPKPSLYSGVAGCAWAIEHILPRVGDPTDQADPNEDVDAMLAEFLSDHRGLIDPELVMGLAGIGTYFLERLPRPFAFAGLELVLGQLAQQAEYLDIGITWRKGLAALSREHRTEYPAGLYNLGIPHGVPGIVAFLARLCASDAANEGSRELLEGAVSWLLAQRNHHGNSVFPYFSAPGLGPVQADSRLAWCYGDLGIAAVVLLAARAAGRTDWEIEALRVAEHAARRPFCESGVEDGMFCHGAAGNAHLFNRLYQATGHPGLRRATQRWYERTLDYFDPANGPTGYVCLVRDPPDAPTDEAEIIAAESYGLAVGVAGVALVLLAGIGRVVPDWDRALAIAVDPAQSASEMQRAI